MYMIQIGGYILNIYISNFPLGIWYFVSYNQRLNIVILKNLHVFKDSIVKYQDKTKALSNFERYLKEGFSNLNAWLNSM